MISIRELITMLTITFFSVTNSIGSTLCEQTFLIHGKTEGDAGLFFFDVLQSGECERRESFILLLEPDKSRIWSRNAEYYSTDSLFVIPGELGLDKKIQLKDSSEHYMLNDSAFVTLPVYDSTFPMKFFRLCNEGMCNAKHWNYECPVNCKDLPQFSGISADLIYTYPGGIYKNYTFTEIIYYPKSNYLVMVTYQPLKAVGGDTNHGLLIFHLH